MPQPIDLFDFSARRLARTSDPHTSHAAAHGVWKFQGAHHAFILKTLDSSSIPLAGEQIADLSDGSLDKVAIVKRMAELREAGLIVKADDVLLHVNRSGRKAEKYRLTVRMDSLDHE